MFYRILLLSSSAGRNSGLFLDVVQLKNEV